MSLLVLFPVLYFLFVFLTSSNNKNTHCTIFCLYLLDSKWSPVCGKWFKVWPPECAWDFPPPCANHCALPSSVVLTLVEWFHYMEDSVCSRISTNSLFLFLKPLKIFEEILEEILRRPRFLLSIIRIGQILRLICKGSQLESGGNSGENSSCLNKLKKPQGWLVVNQCSSHMQDQALPSGIRPTANWGEITPD